MIRRDPGVSLHKQTSTMSRRAASPALSENEVDIFDALYTEDLDGGGGGGGKGAPRAAAADDAFDFLDERLGGDGEDGADGDEAFIALRQAASFRKSSNLKGKTVKKGGGFQAMGKKNPLLFRRAKWAPRLTASQA